MQWLIVGLVAFLVWKAKGPGASQSSGSATSPTNRAYTLRPNQVAGGVAGTAATAGLALYLGYAQKAYQYIKGLYSGYTTVTGNTPVEDAVGSAAESVSSLFLPSSGVVTGDVLGTGAATATAPDILLPTGTLSVDVVEVAPAAAEVGVEAGVEAGVETGAEVGTEVGVEIGAGTALGIAGLGFLAVTVITELINLGLNEYVPGSISKEIMRRKQIALFTQGNQAIELALAAAATFTDAINILAKAPSGTSGQIQWGLGKEFAGVNQAPGIPGTTETPGWTLITKAMADPATLRQHPEAIANFVANLWVQLGPGGQAIYDPRATMTYRALLLSKLPYNADWNYIRQIILNMEPVDPRDRVARDAAIDAVPQLPGEDYFINVGWSRIPTDHVYKFYNIWHQPPDLEWNTPEQVALELATVNPRQSWSGTAPSLSSDMSGGADDIVVQGWFNEGTLEVLPLAKANVPSWMDPDDYMASQVPGFAQVWGSLGYYINPKYLNPSSVLGRSAAGYEPTNLSAAYLLRSRLTSDAGIQSGIQL